jgi:hypothetical protein
MALSLRLWEQAIELTSLRKARALRGKKCRMFVAPPDRARGESVPPHYSDSIIESVLWAAFIFALLLIAVG